MAVRIAAIIIISAMSLVFMTGSSFCQEAGMEGLVDRYVKYTDLQRTQADKEYPGKKMDVEGIVSDVGEGKTFDVANDIERVYYTVTTDVVKTPAGNAYRAILVYKDIKRVEGIDRGQKISFSGNIIRVVDEKLYISVWLSADELTPEERALFK